MHCSPELPDPAAYKALYDATAAKPVERPVSFYAGALAGSWACCSIYEHGALIGFGRLISDGHLHAFVTEMMVHPAQQGRGLGAQVLEALLARCAEAGITDIQLFSAEGKDGFYRRHGFVPRPDSRPGMQYLPAA